MAGTISGRQFGRAGARIGLPRDAGTRDAGYRQPPRRGVVPENAWPDKPIAPREDSSAPISAARLFELTEPQPQAYRDDAYQNAPRIAYRAGRGRLSPGMTGLLVAGGLLSVLIVFVAGFLSAVVMFGEPNAGGEIAIRTGPDAVAAAPASAALLPSAPIVVTPAEADRAPLPAPSPEVMAAEAARQEALQTAQPVVAPADDARAVLAEGIVFPPPKPVPPVREDLVASATPALPALVAPGGNYTLQFGAFRERSNAEALVRELVGVAEAGIVEATASSGGKLFYVRAGAFDTRSEALQAVRLLRRNAGLVAFVHASRGTG